MKARIFIVIQTRFLAPTNTRGSRYSAWVVGRRNGKRAVVEADYALGVDGNHRRVAERLLAQWVTVSGCADRFGVQPAGSSDDGRGNMFVVRLL